MAAVTFDVCGECGSSWTVAPRGRWDNQSACPFCGSQPDGNGPTPALPIVATATVATIPGGVAQGSLSQVNTITITLAQPAPPVAPTWPQVERRATIGAATPIKPE